MIPTSAVRSPRTGWGRQRVAAVAAALALAWPAPASGTGRAVTLSAQDGTSLAGMLYEASNRPSAGIVLVHMLGRSKDEWMALADRLQAAGATVLAIDLRGHGSSGGNGSDLESMVGDVRAAAQWLAARPSAKASSIGIVGASLGANLSALAAVDLPAVRAVALLSPSLDYRGVRLDAATIKRLSDRAVWLLASLDDPLALRTVNELAAVGGLVEQRVSPVRAHGTALLTGDPDVVPALVDWLRRTLIF